MLAANRLTIIAGCVALLLLSGCGGGSGSGSGGNDGQNYGYGFQGRGSALLFNFPSTGPAVFFGAGGGDITALAYTPADSFFRNSKIAFVSNRAGNDEIFVMNYDGTGVTRLTNNSAAEEDPAFSPDGQFIYFDSSRDGVAQLFMMKPDGTGVTKLTQDSASDFAPCSSPDGRFLVYVSTRTGGQHLWVSDMSGLGGHHITTGTSTELHPDVSSDGTRICFISNRSADAKNHVWACNPDGTGLVQVTSGTSTEADCRWAPDGKTILFRNQLGYLYTINSDGTGVAPLATGSFARYSPFFTPDGQKVVYAADNSTGRDIWVINRDGTGVPVRITNDGSTNDHPAVSGTQVTTRVYVGSAGADRGKNPSFGISLGGFVATMVQNDVVEVLAMDAADRTAIYAEYRYLGDNAGAAMVLLSGTEFTSLLQDNGRDLAPTKIVGTPGLIAPGPDAYSLMFDAATGKLTSVIPISRGRARGSGSQDGYSNGLYVIRGNITAAIDMKTKRNLAPKGATAVAVDPHTGEIREVH